MPQFSLDATQPTVHPDAFVAPTATLIGDVRIEEGASVWFNAVLRADYSPIVVRAGANVQDCSVMHGTPDCSTEVGTRATVGHGCVIHGAVIGTETIVGNGTVVMDGARIGERSLVAAHSMVGPGSDHPGDALIAGSPAQVRREIPGTSLAEMLDLQPTGYMELARRYLSGLGTVRE